MTDDGYRELTAADLAHRWRERDPLEQATEAAAVVNEDYATEDSALRHLLDCSWNDLLEAQQRAINGKWSIECEWIVQRIAGLARLIGPTDWGHVPVALLLNGWYERIHEAAGCPTPLTPEDRARAQAVQDRRLS